MKKQRGGKKSILLYWIKLLLINIKTYFSLVLIFILFFIYGVGIRYTLSEFLLANLAVCYIFINLLLISVAPIDMLKIKPVDKIDEFFLKKEQKRNRIITMWKSFFILAINFCINFAVLYQEIIGFHMDTLEAMAIEIVFLTISWIVVKIVSPWFTPYSYNSEFLFYSKKQYAIRIWNFIVHRPTAYENQLEETEGKVWDKGTYEITLEQIDFAKKELEKYPFEFLNKLKVYLLYPKNYEWNPFVVFEDYLQYLWIAIGILLPIGLEVYFKISENKESFLVVAGIIILGSIIYFLMFLFWRWVTRYHLKMQLKAYLSWLIDAEIERREKL